MITSRVLDAALLVEQHISKPSVELEVKPYFLCNIYFGISTFFSHFYHH